MAEEVGIGKNDIVFSNLHRAWYPDALWTEDSPAAVHRNQGRYNEVEAPSGLQGRYWQAGSRTSNLSIPHPLPVSFFMLTIFP